MSETTKCERCGGCGKIADSDSGEPWTAWAALPPGSDLAVRMGIVRPIECQRKEAMSEAETPDLDVIDARAQGATPGPWTVDETEDDGIVEIGVFDATHADLATTHVGPWQPEALATARADMRLMAAARTDVPALTAYARELERRLAEAEREADAAEAELRVLRGEARHPGGEAALREALGAELFGRLWGPELERLGAVVDVALQRADVVAAENAHLRAALTMRVGHREDCDWLDEDVDRPCSCGSLDAALGRTP